MSKLTFEYDESGKGIISAFAFNTGHLIEELIKQKTDNLIEKNLVTDAKILEFHTMLEEPIKSQYAKHFGIIVHTGSEM